MPLQNWEILEKDCVDFLNKKYSTSTGCYFRQSGGHNSRELDIYVEKYGKLLFSMETKMSAAQCGQFVLFPDKNLRKFVYSTRNEFPINDFSKKIIEIMEMAFNDYCLPSTRRLPCDKKLLYDWVKHHYQVERGSKYLITKGQDYVIFNIDLFEKYYDISAVYRVKKSGSANPNNSDMNVLYDVLEFSTLEWKNLTNDGHFVSVELPAFNEDRLILISDRYDYLFKRFIGDNFRITKLSNTFNANVIFSINLLREQDPKDLRDFEAELLSK